MVRISHRVLNKKYQGLDATDKAWMKHIFSVIKSGRHVTYGLRVERIPSLFGLRQTGDCENQTHHPVIKCSRVVIWVVNCIDTCIKTSFFKGWEQTEDVVEIMLNVRGCGISRGIILVEASR